MSNTSIYYIYAYIREKDGSPYYIGKGKGKRAFDSKYKTGKPPKDKSRIIFLKTGLTEEKALELEREYISLYGRKDLGTGILLNKTNGGDGVSGKSNETIDKIKIARKKQKIIMTNEWKENIGKGNKGKTRTEIHKNQRREIMKRLWSDPEYREKMQQAQRGKKRSDEHKKNISIGMINHQALKRSPLSQR